MIQCNEKYLLWLKSFKFKLPTKIKYPSINIDSIVRKKQKEKKERRHSIIEAKKKRKNGMVLPSFCSIKDHIVSDKTRQTDTHRRSEP